MSLESHNIDKNKLEQQKSDLEKQIALLKEEILENNADQQKK
jgi:uncharacterized small protein (DUF1192 family)